MVFFCSLKSPNIVVPIVIYSSILFSVFDKNSFSVTFLSIDARISCCFCSFLFYFYYYLLLISLLLVIKRNRKEKEQLNSQNVDLKALKVRLFLLLIDNFVFQI